MEHRVATGVDNDVLRIEPRPVRPAQAAPVNDCLNPGCPYRYLENTMSVKRPSKADFLIAAQDHGYDLSDSQMESFLSLADETLGSYEAIDALYAAHVAQPAPLREHSKPAAAENLYGAWYVKTHIAGAARSTPLSVLHA